MSLSSGTPTLRPIGVLRTPFTRISDCPRNPRQLDPAPACEAHVLPEYAEGLASLDGFSHLIVLYWLHDARERLERLQPDRTPTDPVSASVMVGEGRPSTPVTQSQKAWMVVPSTTTTRGEYGQHETLVLTPPFDGTPRGVFATRAPSRPNPIGLSVTAFDGFADKLTLRLRYLDCLDGTPLLDIKPYLPSIDSVPDAATGWLSPHVGKLVTAAPGTPPPRD